MTLHRLRTRIEKKSNNSDCTRKCEKNNGQKAEKNQNYLL